MKTPKLAMLAGVAAGLLTGQSAMAGAKLKIDDEAMIELGFRVQALGIFSESESYGNVDPVTQLSDFGNYEDFRVRRARFRLKGTVNKHVTAFIQTEASDDAGGGGSDMRVIDSWVQLKYNNWLSLLSGQHMSPASRMNLTSSGGLMTIDRPGINTKTLTWGTRATGRFATSTIGDTDAGLRGDNAVRDVGFTLFGSGKLGGNSSLKYYAGIYDGVQEAGHDKERVTGRVQLNFFDPEPGYFNNSTYLGKKKTIGIGISADSQDKVSATMAGPDAEYNFWSFDAFMEWPMGGGSLTAEAAYLNLDLDDAAEFLQSQGDGYYFSAGYYINKWQPWVHYESWDSDYPGGMGSFDMWRAGISYFMKGHNANIKLGYEQWNHDVNFSGTSEDSIGTFVVGIYTTY